MFLLDLTAYNSRYETIREEKERLALLVLIYIAKCCWLPVTER